MKKVYDPFMKVLAEMDALGIHSREKLVNDPRLCAQYWLAAEGFSRFCLASKSTTNKAGEILPGNIYKLDALIGAGVTTKEDLERDVMVKLVDELDDIIYDVKKNHRTVSHQYNSAYRSINNLIVDLYRRFFRKGVKFVSLQETVRRSRSFCENANVFEEVVGDRTYDGDRVCAERERLAEIIEDYEKELAERRERVLEETRRLAKKPAEVFARMGCTHLGIKPLKLANMVIEKGCELVYNKIVFENARKSNIDPEELRGIITGCKLTAESLKADTNNPKIIAGQISRLNYRADKRLRK